MLRILKPFSFIPALLLMYMIYSFSAQEGALSAQFSYKVSHKLVEIGGEMLGADFQDWEVDQLAERFHGPLRKIAHMGEYFALAVAVAFPLYVYGLRGIILLIAAGLICVGFACGDEYHQSLVAGRGPSKRDVLIDSFGVFWGIILVRIIGWTGRKTIFRPFSRKRRRGSAYEDQDRRPAEPEYEYAREYGQGVSPAPGYRPYSGPDHRRQGYDYDGPGRGSEYSRSEYGSSEYGRPECGGSGYGRSEYRDSGYGRPEYRDSGYGRPEYDSSEYDRPEYGRPGQDMRERGGSEYSRPGRGRQPGTIYYGQPPYGFPPQETYEPEEEASTSDYLSEDMSLRKLMSDLHEQKQARRSVRNR